MVLVWGEVFYNAFQVWVEVGVCTRCGMDGYVGRVGCGGPVTCGECVIRSL
jgi:hypothetical protein